MQDGHYQGKNQATTPSGQRGIAGTSGRGPRDSSRIREGQQPSIATERRKALDLVDAQLAAIEEELRRQNDESQVALEDLDGNARYQRQRFIDVLNLLPAYVVLLSPDYHVPFANRFFEERFGKSNGQRCYEYLFHRTEPCENCRTYNVLKTGEPERWEWTGPDDRTYEIHDFPFAEADGLPLIMEVGLDITEVKRAEASLKEANETLEQHVAERTAALERTTQQLERSNEDLQQFASAAGHDLQEPLRVVAGFLTLLEKNYGPQLDGQAREYIAYAVGGAERMSEMIRGLLAYSRVDRKGKEPQPVNAEPCLDAALANLDASIREAGAKVTRDPLPTLMVDASQLLQLFQNLIGNAIKFRKSERPCLVHVGADQRDGQWVFFVRDNGIGIPPQQHDRIFEIFRRLHSREKYPGTGIGLAICKRIVERTAGKFGSSRSPAKERPSASCCRRTEFIPFKRIEIRASALVSVLNQQGESPCQSWV